MWNHVLTFVGVTCFSENALKPDHFTNKKILRECRNTLQWNVACKAKFSENAILFVFKTYAGYEFFCCLQKLTCWYRSFSFVLFSFLLQFCSYCISRQSVFVNGLNVSNCTFLKRTKNSWWWCGCTCFVNVPQISAKIPVNEIFYFLKNLKQLNWI